MGSTTAPLLEEIIIATLYRAGRKIRLTDDEALAKLFNDVAKEDESPFAGLEWHPVYHDSRIGPILQDLDLGGFIVRENKPLRYFRPTPHTLGQYGKSLYKSLDEDTKQAVDRVVAKIKTLYS